MKYVTPTAVRYAPHTAGDASAQRSEASKTLVEAQMVILCIIHGGIIVLFISLDGILLFSHNRL